MFDESDRLIDDPCAQSIRNAQNQAWSKHQVHNLRGSGAKLNKSEKQATRFAEHHRNLRSWHGYGNVDRSKVDVDSELRNDKIWTNTPYKTPLHTRTFVAVPDLVRGPPKPVTEAKIMSGVDTTLRYRCDPLSEKQFQVFHPTVMPVCVKHLIPPWTHGGDSSRDINRSPEFMNMMGYRYDGRMWVRNC